MTTAKPGSYKRLGFLHSSVQRAAGLAHALYSGVRAYTPGALQPTLESAEAYSAPLLARAADLGGSALSAADENVDYVISTGGNAISNSKKTVQDGLSSVQTIHATNTAHLRAAFASYLTSVQQISDWAIKNLNPVRGARAALDALRASFARLQELTDPDTFAKFVQDRWAAFASIPLVAGVLDAMQPITATLASIFTSLHDYVVSLGVYKLALDTGKSAWGWISQSYPYRLGAQYLYPLVQPVADPALAKLSQSKVVSSTLGYWAPAKMV